VLSQYTENEAVIFWVNKVGPYNNPQETYNYNYLPFCRANPQKKAEHSWGGLGEVLEGNEVSSRADNVTPVAFAGNL
jgi:transmembrane 9 superfamily protein 3